MTAYLRYPHVNDRDLVFVADDDLWLGSIDGGRAHRLTADHDLPRTPRFSPEGDHIAWSAMCGQGHDIHVMDREGNRRQLTWWGTRRLQVARWCDSEHIVVVSDHASPHRRLASLYKLGLDGSVEALPWGFLMSADFHADGRCVAGSVNFNGPERWKRYRGGEAAKVWLSDTSQKTWQRLLPDETASITAPFWFHDRIVFVSDRNAVWPGKATEQAQLWSMKPDGSDLRQHTQHTVDDGYVRDATTDGTTIVFHSRGNLFAVDSLKAKPRMIEVEITLPVPEPVELVPTEQLETIAVDHRGDGSVLEWRGAAFYLTHRGGPARALSAQSGVRVREPVVLADSGKAAWASDAEGDDCIEISRIDGDGDPRRIAHGKLGRVLTLVSNHDGSALAVASHDGKVLIVDSSNGKVTQAGISANGEATGLTFSPNGRYLVWREAMADEGMLGRLVGYDITTKTGFELTKGQFNDYSPAFSRDGRYLYFLSSRTIDPTYDELGFDLSFTNTVRPWIIPVKAEDNVPFGPSADGWSIAEEPEKTDDGGKPDEDSADEAIVFDTALVEDRMLPLPVPSGRYVELQTTYSGVIWRRPSDYTGVLGTGKTGDEDAKDSIECYDVVKRKVTTIVDACDAAAVSGEGKHLVVRNGDEIWVQPSDAKPEDDDRITVDLARLRRHIVPREEWRQMFDENARLMRDHFWREDMDGVDWDTVCARYRPLIDRITTHDELIDILWECVGELNTSHAYVVPPHIDDGTRVGWLGARVERNAKGEFVITEILEGESSDPAARSPLRAAGVAAQVGDVITAIDGNPTSESPAIGALLQGAAGKVVELTLARKRMKRRVAVVPIADESALLYHAWVRQRARYVDEKSGGRIGYVHVPDMAASGWAEFQRLIGAAARKEAVIADVRFNGGGHTSALVIERLSRKLIGWGMGRHFDKPSAYPHQGLRGPVVFVTNPWAGSDGDIVTAAAQTMGLGPVVGERSWGGVIGIDGRFQLVDGTDVTQPRYPHWFPGYGWGQENFGTAVDIEVPMGPTEWESGDDLQLDVAINEALRRLKEKPAATPPEFDPPRFGDS